MSPARSAERRRPYFLAKLYAGPACPINDRGTIPNDYNVVHLTLNVSQSGKKQPLVLGGGGGGLGVLVKRQIPIEIQYPFRVLIKYIFL